MPPKPGNAFAQRKEMERQTSQRLQQHTRDTSNDTTSSADTVRLIPLINPQEESSAAAGDAQDMPDSPRTTMAMFIGDSAPNQRQEDLQEHTTPLSQKKARKQNQKVEANQSSSSPQASLPTRSSAMPEPLFSEKQSGLDFIKSKFSRGKRAFTKTTPAVSTSQTENVFAPFNFEERQETTCRSGQADVNTAASALKDTDSAVLYAEAKASPQAPGVSTHVPAAGPQQSTLPNINVSAVKLPQPSVPSIHVPATTLQQSTSTIHVTALTPQQSSVHNVHASAPSAQQIMRSRINVLENKIQQSQNVAAALASADESQQIIPASMQLPQSAIPDRYRTSSKYGQLGTDLPSFQPHAGMMPYSDLVPRSHSQQGDVSTGTQQTYITTQSQYTPTNLNEGIILGGTSITPTRQGTYAIVGNAELVPRSSVPSMTGIVSELSPTSPYPQHQGIGCDEPVLPFENQPRLNAPLPSLPASVSVSQSTCSTHNTQYRGPPSSTFGEKMPQAHHRAVIGAWEQMQTQYPDSMPQLSPIPQQYSSQAMSADPTYLNTIHGPILATLLYNYHAAADTKSEGQKSDLETGEVTDDDDDDDEAAGNIKQLLRKSGLRRAFSNDELKLSHHISSLNAEAPIFVQAAASAAAPSPPPTVSVVAPQANQPPDHQSHRHHHHHYDDDDDHNNTTTTTGGPAPTPPHPSYQSSASILPAHQIASSFAILHHHLERDNRGLREHVSTTTDTAQDGLKTYLDEKFARLARVVLGRMVALEGEVKEVRRLVDAGAAAWPLPGAGVTSLAAPGGSAVFASRGGGEGRERKREREKGRGKGREREGQGESEEVLWRRPGGGGVGEIGGRWYGEEVGEE